MSELTGLDMVVTATFRAAASSLSFSSRSAFFLRLSSSRRSRSDSVGLGERGVAGMVDVVSGVGTW